MGRGRGLDKAPVCQAQGPRDNGSLLGPRGTATSGGGGGGAPPTLALSGAGGVGGLETQILVPTLLGLS